MSSEISIPLTLKTGANDGSIQQSDQAMEDWMAYWASDKIIETFPDAGDRYSKSLTLDPTNATNIGQFVDTFYNQPIGTHPGTSITEGSVTTNLYQMADSASITRYARENYPIPVITETATGGDIHEMPDSGILQLAQRIAGDVHLNEYAGAYRLSGNSPGAGWTKWIDRVFTDSKTTYTNTKSEYHYHIWRLTDNAAADEPTVPVHFPLTLKDGVSPDLREITKEEAKEIAREILLIGQVGTGVGDYELRSSAQGAPTASGQWVARGTAVDTKMVVANRQYATVKYTSPQYSRQYTGQYTGTYTGISFANVDVQYAGSRVFTFAGSRFYNGSYNGNRKYSGGYGGKRNYGGQYAGVRTFAGSRNFAGPRQFSNQYSRPVKFFELEPANFSGNRYFAGSRFKPTNFSGVRVVNYSAYYAGFRGRYYSGFRQKKADEYFNGSRGYATSVTQYFAGTRFFSGPRAFSDGYATPAFRPESKQFNGPRPANFARPAYRVVPDLFTGPRPENFTRQRVQQYSGYRSFVGDFASIGTPGGGFRKTVAEAAIFSGPRSFSDQYSRYSVLYFSGSRPSQYSGARAFATKLYFSGVRTWQFSGARSFATTLYFSGFRAKPVNFTRYVQFARETQGISIAYENFLGQRINPYAGNFLGPRPANFLGSRSYPIQQQFVGPFPFGQAYGRFNAQFGGQVIETYSGVRIYSGSRDKPSTFNRPQSFTGSQSFAGSRNYGSYYLGSRTYSGSYQGVRNYVGDYTGSRVFQFTGQVPTTYTRQYTGQYTGTYVGNYTSQYSNQYTGQTIIDQKQTIETFTLYCRVAA